MPTVPRIGDLQIEQDLGFQRREWIFERIAWVAMTAFVLAALLGLFGTGPLSDRTAASADASLEVDYERFLNIHSATELNVRVSGEVTAPGTFRIAINQDYLTGMHILRMTPEPERSETGDNRQVFLFRAVDPGRPAVVQFHLEPCRTGARQAQIVAGGGPTVEFGQLVYP
jgi:hypothetical protein